MEGGGASYRLWRYCNQDNDNAAIATMMDAMSVAAAEQSKLPRAMFLLNMHMDMGKTHWREEGDPIMYRIKERDIFLCKRYFFQYLSFWHVFLPSVGCRVG
jgi:hypothetical protein